MSQEKVKRAMERIMAELDKKFQQTPAPQCAFIDLHHEELEVISEVSGYLQNLGYFAKLDGQQLYICRPPDQYDSQFFKHEDLDETNARNRQAAINEFLVELQGEAIMSRLMMAFPRRRIIQKGFLIGLQLEECVYWTALLCPNKPRKEITVKINSLVESIEFISGIPCSSSNIVMHKRKMDLIEIDIVPLVPWWHFDED